MAKLAKELSGGVKRVMPVSNLHTRTGEKDSVDRCVSGPLHFERREEVDAEPVETEDRIVCDACPFCWDACLNSECSKCSVKREKPNVSGSPVAHSATTDRVVFCGNSAHKKYTPCQIRRHNHADSAWLLVGDTIYDATSYVSKHPGGVSSILRKSGGQADCARDMAFHSKQAIKIWKKNRVGKLTKCPGSQGDFNDPSRDSDNCGTSEQCVIS